MLLKIYIWGGDNHLDPYLMYIIINDKLVKKLKTGIV